MNRSSSGPFRNSRGDGIGIEFTPSVVRGVELVHDEPGRVRAAAEVGIRSAVDDRSVLDALVRLRAELGGVRAPTRLALFPPGSSLSRIDATGLVGAELNQLRERLRLEHGVASTVLVDDGPRRWMMAVRWDESAVRRLEELVERAGFIDVAIDPSPLALARVLPQQCTVARRTAAVDEAFDVIIGTVPCAACSIDAVGRHHPGLLTGVESIPAAVFDEMYEPADLVAQIEFMFDADALIPVDLVIADSTFPTYPEHDIRATGRQCVALGAAVGAAGLAGRLRPMDLLMPMAERTELLERPWAIERVSTLPVRTETKTISATRRLMGRVIPRRRR